MTRGSGIIDFTNGRYHRAISVENINDLMLLHHIDIVSRRPRGMLQRREMTDIPILADSIQRLGLIHLKGAVAPAHNEK